MSFHRFIRQNWLDHHNGHLPDVTIVFGFETSQGIIGVPVFEGYGAKVDDVKLHHLQEALDQLKADYVKPTLFVQRCRDVYNQYGSYVGTSYWVEEHEIDNPQVREKLIKALQDEIARRLDDIEKRIQRAVEEVLSQA